MDPRCEVGGDRLAHKISSRCWKSRRCAKRYDAASRCVWLSKSSSVTVTLLVGIRPALATTLRATFDITTPSTTGFAGLSIVARIRLDVDVVQNNSAELTVCRWTPPSPQPAAGPTSSPAQQRRPPSSGDRGGRTTKPGFPGAAGRSNHRVRRVDELRLVSRSDIRRLDAVPGDKPLAHADPRRVARGNLPFDVRDDRSEPAVGVPAGQSRP